MVTLAYENHVFHLDWSLITEAVERPEYQDLDHLIMTVLGHATTLEAAANRDTRALPQGKVAVKVPKAKIPLFYFDDQHHWQHIECLQTTEGYHQMIVDLQPYLDWKVQQMSLAGRQ